MDQTQDRLALIDVFDRDGRLHGTHDVYAWPITLGRALHNTVVLDDPHVAPSHARLEQAEDGSLQLAIGPSLNGGRLGKRRLASGDHARLEGAASHSFQLGSTRLRLRLPDPAIAAERPLAVGARPLLTTLLLAIVLALLVAWPIWLARDPGDDWRGWLPVLVGGPAALLVWCAAWGLASKIFQHRFEFWGHLGIAVRVLVPAEALELLLPQLAASLDLPSIWAATNWLTPLALAVLCWCHARRVLPEHQRGLALLTTLVWGVATAVTLTTNQQRHDRFNAEPYMSALPLPMLRWYSAIPSKGFVDEARKLQAPLQERVKQVQDEDKSDAP
ncbi:MAG TPA: FHA domain-containing protein [Ideonella sp.]|nr:FHA domain-containing protein [Ideonella sp.]